MKRPFDLFLAISATIVLFAPSAFVSLLVKLTSKGPILYWSNRVGRHNALFSMPKFRSMRVGTPAVATHLLTNPIAHIGPSSAAFYANPAWTNYPSFGAYSKAI